MIQTAAIAASKMPANPDAMKKLRQRRLRERTTVGILSHWARFSAGVVGQRKLLGRKRPLGACLAVGGARVKTQHRQRLEAARRRGELGEPPGAAIRQAQRLADGPRIGR